MEGTVGGNGPLIVLAHIREGDECNPGLPRPAPCSRARRALCALQLPVLQWWSCRKKAADRMPLRGPEHREP